MSHDKYHLRDYRESDLRSLSRIYSSAIRHLGPTAYSNSQIVAWASFADEPENFRSWVEGATTFVAVAEDGECVGFAGLSEGAHVASVFVSPAHQRQGIGSRLLARVVDTARARRAGEITTHASVFSKPLFEQHGFVVKALEHTEVKGVGFERYAMQAVI